MIDKKRYSAANMDFWFRFLIVIGINCLNVEKVNGLLNSTDIYLKFSEIRQDAPELTSYLNKE